MFNFGKSNIQSISSKGNKHRITINGETIEVVGNSISIRNGKLYIDGVLFKERKDFEKDYKLISITIEGDVNYMDADCSVTINGNIKGSVDAGGSVTVGGDVDGDIKSGGSTTVKGSHNGRIIAGGSVRTGC